MAAPTNVELWIPINDVNRLALSIPIHRCREFAVHPLKWLLFLGYGICGREGYLSTSATGPEVDDYTVQVKARPYHFIPVCMLKCPTLASR